jgi:hypothetical protein
VSDHRDYRWLLALSDGARTSVIRAMFVDECAEAAETFPKGHAVRLEIEEQARNPLAQNPPRRTYA